MPNEIASLLGLCRRAGQVIAGEFAVEKAIKAGKAAVLLLSSDASERTRKRFAGFAERAHIPWFQIAARDELGWAIGQPPRVTVAVQPGSLATNLIGRLKQLTEATADPRG
jgi:ribosomal protein L7Ae-like RNA K-turn-binding protein